MPLLVLVDGDGGSSRRLACIYPYLSSHTMLVLARASPVPDVPQGYILPPQWGGRIEMKKIGWLEVTGHSETPPEPRLAVTLLVEVKAGK